MPPPAAVSVVIPTYRRAEYLQAALDSVFGQTRPPREVIVVDDGSPDDTAARLAPLAQAGRIRYVRQANAGMSAARNAGAALATSAYLLFLDDDDLLVPTALAWLVDEIERDPAVGFVYGDAVLFSGAVPPIGPSLHVSGRARRPAHDGGCAARRAAQRGSRSRVRSWSSPRDPEDS
ncbi:hypothetical protein tb265_16950 [Gemmatimonadetes bacterium T265]|nr:hypothetical protein tb265_16950 [Gemmatimonadetes bacterium T265]